MADEKWIGGLNGGLPVRDAARRVLAVRLGVVRERLPLAVLEAADDVEHVHQLRVGTRRATAAVRIFADVLPGKRDRQVRRTLRQIRRAAGAARDEDVFLAMIGERMAAATPAQQRGFDFLRGYGQGRRLLAQQTLTEATRRQEERLDRLMAKLDAQLADAPPGPALRTLAGPRLRQLLGALDQAASGDLQDYAALHQVRILGKQLRYALEVFESCFAEPLRTTVYPAIVEMQDLLGAANDSHVAAGRLTELKEQLQRSPAWPSYRPGIEALLRYHQRRLPRQRERFLAWREQWRASGAEQALAGLR